MAPRKKRVFNIKAPSTNTTLIWIDEQPLLEQERKQCKKVTVQLDRVSHDWEHFESVSRPAFEAWFFKKFQPKLDEIRALQSKKIDLEEIIENVKMNAFATGRSEAEVYADMQRAQGKHEDIDKENLFSEFEEMASLFESFFRRMIDEEHCHEDDCCADTNQNTAYQPPLMDEVPLETREEVRKKEIYRTLSKKLHPDLNGSLTIHEKELWYQLQNVYDGGTVEELEIFASQIDNSSEVNGVVNYKKVKSLSLLRGIVKNIQKKIRFIRKSIREAKKHPGWKFDTKDAHEVQLLEKNLKWELDCAIESFREETQSFEKMIENFKSKRKSKNKLKKNRSSSKP